VNRRPWPRDPRYLVGSDGSIVGPSGGLRSLQHDPKGYPQIGVAAGGGRSRSVRVHVIVCETWHGPRPPRHEVAHGDGDKDNCAASNLRWSTRKDNHQDKVQHGTALRGERVIGAKLTDADVRTIRQQYAAGWVTQRALGERFGVTQTLIGRVVRGEAWRHVA
jgi:hypothetical protein